MRALATALVLSALLLLPAEAQNGRRLKPWLVGLTVVVVFLFVVFVLMLAHRLWCSGRRAKDDESMVRMESNADLSKEGKERKEKEKKAREEGASNLGVELEDEKPAESAKTTDT